MVLEKRSEYGFHGYQIPTMPRGCRSARKKRSVRHNASHAELCAIDLLATVAGNLLLEKDVSASPRAHLPVKDKDSTRVPPRTEDKPVKVEPCDQGSCDEGAPVIRCQKLSHKHAFKETKSQASTTTSGFLGLATELVDSKLKAQDVSPNARHSPATIVSSPAAKVEKEEEGMATPIRISKSVSSMDVLIDQSNRLKKATEEDEMELDTKPPPPPRTPVLASSDSSVEVPATYTTPRNFMPRSSSTIPMFHDKYTVDHEVSGDGDEDDGNSSACTHPSSASPRATSAAPAYRPQRIGDRRIRKLLSSRFWKVGPAPLKDGEFYDRDLLRSKKLCYTRQKTQRSSFKRKKLFERSSVSSSSAGIAAETISKLSSDYNNNNNGKKCIKAEQGNGTCSSITSHRTSFKSEDYKVKLKIKSFKVPELFIEMPETATVGSLKRAVLETVTAMLGNGLKVGVIYQGRKVRDDSRTLLQAGISGGDKLDSLNFSLEPNPSPGAAPLLEHGSPSTSRPEPVLPLEQCRSPRPLTARLPALNEALTGNPDAREQQLETKPLGLASAAGSDNSSKAVSGYANSNGDPSRAIVPVSSNSSKELVPVNPPSPHCSDLALAVVPASNKCTRRPEMAQRRTRRPFSVSEVEALVQAVEKLGTGRWRDVKLQAFETAKHRTYVDLKDKWKTLVHTARISPQQRRGEPVPQDLLDRVLVAHAHWSQHQARLQSSKHVTGTSSSAIPQQQSHSCVVAGLLPPPQHTEQQQLQPLALTPPKPAALV